MARTGLQASTVIVPALLLLLQPALVAASGPSGTWVQLTTAHSPGSRTQVGMVYDSHAHRALLVGGTVSGSPTNDVWQLSLGITPDWDTVHVDHSLLPPARNDGGLAYDPAHNQLVYYGGNNGSPPYRGDLWTLTLASTSTWTKSDDVDTSFNCSSHPDVGTRPCPRNGTRLAWSSNLSSVCLAQGDACFPKNDTWKAAISGGSTTWTETAGYGDCDYYDPVAHGDTHDPDVRSDHTLIYDAQHARLVVFGGFYLDPDDTPANAWRASTDGTTWTKLPALDDGSFMNHTAVYDSARARMIVYGGNSDESHPLELSLPATDASCTWTTLTPSGTGPSVAYNGHGAIFDPDNDRMIVFGTNNQTWALNFDSTAPSAISTLHEKSQNAGSVYLRWTAPSDNTPFGRAASYDIRYSTSEIDEGSFASATAFTNSIVPAAAGSRDSINVTGLTTNGVYYFAIKSRDVSGNVSAMSNLFCAVASAMYQDCPGPGDRMIPTRPADPVTSLAIEAIRPTPSRGLLFATITLPSAERARLEVLDVSGRRVRSVDLAALGAGRHEIDLGKDGTLWPGYYSVVLRQGSQSARRSALVIR